ncbi:CDC73-domain-containing protein [Lichtheimia hyalospora FSU 10163]|nr:CDC73-domain-containing protein [Lichtheimia hyalospora FSU 10163]
MQPLQLLRNHTCNKKPVILKDANDNVVTSVADASTVWFDEESFARNTPTTFPKNSSDDTYTLDTLIFLVQNEHLDNSAYFKECRQRDIEHVSIVDRKKVLDYLTGKVDTQPTKQSSSTAGVRKQREDVDETKGKAESNNENEPASKRVKFDDKRSHVSIEKLREREKVLQSSSSILQGDKDFYTIVKAMNPTFGKNGASSTIQKSSSKPSKPTSKDRIPIIIVPAAPTAKFTLFNIKQFLENFEYVDPQQLRAQGMKKPDRVSIERYRRDGQVTVYHVIDNVAHLKQNDWDRVCCVFASGQQWQFKGWKYERPIDLFSHVKGFYAKWADERIKGPAGGWNVTPLDISRSQRHNDKLSAAKFWDALDKHMGVHHLYGNY